jgi:hypothetical protein
MSPPALSSMDSTIWTERKIAEFYEGYPMYWDMTHGDYKGRKKKDATLNDWVDQNGLDREYTYIFLFSHFILNCPPIYVMWHFVRNVQPVKKLGPNVYMLLYIFVCQCFVEA